MFKFLPFSLAMAVVVVMTVAAQYLQLLEGLDADLRTIAEILAGTRDGP